MLFRFARYKARGYFKDPCEKESNELREALLSTRRQREVSIHHWIHADCEVINDGSQIGASLNECHESFLRYCRRVQKMPCEVRMFRSVIASMGFQIKTMMPIEGGKALHIIGLLPRAEFI
jgi:hypothetical protein